jgi:hypothetical protein
MLLKSMYAYALTAGSINSSSRKICHQWPVIIFIKYVQLDKILGTCVLYFFIPECYENRVLRRIFGPRRDEETGDWRKLHNEELHSLYYSPSIIRMRSRRTRWAGHVARMEERKMQMGDWWESQKVRDHWEDLDVGGWTVLKWILQR